MGFSLGLWYVLVGFAVGVVDAYSPREFSRNDVPWRFVPRTVPPARQIYNPSLSHSSPWALVDASEPRSLSALKPVHVECGEAQVVISVKRDLFGTGRLIQATDLTLGSPGCQPTSYEAAENTVTFAVGLHECGSDLQMTPDSLVYSVTLFYRPNPGSSPIIVRTSPVDVPIECHYPRKDNVSSKAIKPTWVPFTSTISAEQRLAFSLRLMNEDWSAQSTSNRFQLGEAMHIQGDVSAENHVDLRLFVDSCVATLSPDIDSSPRYAVVDYHGCLVDGRSDDSKSAFVSPRPSQDSLRFTVDAFRFSRDIGNMIYITCHLKVTAADQPLDPLKKACSFDKASNSWYPVEGSVDICSCCETQNCEFTGSQLGRHNTWRRGPGGRFQRDAVASRDGLPLEKVEADLLIGPVILDAPKASVHLPEDQRRKELMEQGFQEKFLFTVMGLAVATTILGLASVTLAFLVACQKNRRSAQL